MTERLTIIVDERGSRVVRRRFGQLGDSARDAGSDIGFMTRALAGIAAAGAVATLTAATAAAADFQTAISEVNTLLGGVPDQIEQVSSAALDLSRQFGGAPTQQAQAFYQAISAGAADAAEATEILTVANQLAIGGVSDVATATDALTSVLNAYGDAVNGAADVSDTLFVGVRAGKTTVDELASSIGRVAPLAATAGVSFQETVGALAALTKGGISTNEAVTGLRAVLSNIARPSQQAAELAEQLGLDFSIAGLQAQGFAGFMDEVVRATGGSQQALVELFGSVEALTPVLALTGNNAQDFADTLEQMENRAGATQQAFDIMADTFNFQLDRVLQGLRAQLIEIGTVALPILTDALRFLADNMDGIARAAQFAAAALAVIAGPAIITGIATLTTNMFRLAAATATVGFAQLISPLRSIVAIGAARPFASMAAGIARFVPGAAAAGSVLGGLARAAGIFLRFLGPIGVALSVIIGLFVNFNSEARVSSQGLATFGDVATVVFQRIQSVLTPVVNFFRDGWNTAISTVQRLFPNFELTFVGVMRAIAGAFDTVIGVFAGGWAAIVAGAQNAAAGLANTLIRAFNFVADKFTGFINGIIDGLNAVGGVLGFDQIQNRVARNFGEFEGAGETMGEAFSRGFNSSTGAGDLFNGILADAETLAQNRAADQRLIELANQQNNPLSPDDPVTPPGADPITIPGSGGAGGGSASELNDTLKEANALLEERKRILEEIQGPAQQLELRQTALQQLLDEGKISTEEFSQAMRDLNVEITGLDNSIQGGLLNGLARIAQQANNIGQQMSDFVVNAFESATDAIVEFAKTGQFNVRQFFQDLFAQLLKLAANQLFSQLIGGLFPGLGGGGAGGLLGGLLGFQNGGEFMVGGQDNNPDSQLVAFRATRGERVKVETPGQQAANENGGGGGTVVQSPPVNVAAVLSPNDIVGAFDNNEGETVVLNMLQRNASTVRQIAQG